MIIYCLLNGDREVYFAEKQDALETAQHLIETGGGRGPPGTIEVLLIDLGEITPQIVCDMLNGNTRPELFHDSHAITLGQAASA